jgi:hypothetical protein
MAFSQSSIAHVAVQEDSADLLVTWNSTASEGTTFQVYVDHRLSWFGRSRICHVPVPAGASGRNVWVDVGTVNGGEAPLDFSSSLASLALGADTVELSWSGGTYLDTTGHDDVQGFRVYRSSGPGAALDLSAPLAVVPAYPGGWVSDGFGIGGFGLGGFGRAAGSYSWSSGPLAAGTWLFRVVPYDRSGTERGSGQETSAVVAAPPRPPAPAPGGERLTYAYSGPDTRLVTLQWLPSPSA